MPLVSSALPPAALEILHTGRGTCPHGLPIHAFTVRRGCPPTRPHLQRWPPPESGCNDGNGATW
ncbi:hypothetical protein WMF18_07245 [Sorangium sp. So ce315]|uniref:hypothetical protein n=1 Tax=Sorangium sp. So ce315 TaxID=3133299 RepID=UPI003F5F2D55